MIRAQFDRPLSDEHAPYYSSYIDKVPPGELVDLLATQIGVATALLAPISEEKAATSYAPNKWTIKEVVGHLADTERVFAYRAMTFARADTAALPGFDENAWITPGRFNERPFPDLVEEWRAARRASVALLSGLPADAPARRGTANGRTLSVRAAAYIIYGHVAHHLGVLQERYLA
jgi:hypothetical protein